jgi:hypothetical protein
MSVLSLRKLTILKNLARRGDIVAQAADEGLGVENTQGNLTFVRFTDVATLAGTGVGASLASNSTTNTITLTQMAHIRSVRATFAASWDGGNIVLVGTDQDGMPQTETLLSNAGANRDSAKVWKTLTSATKTAVGATANAVTLGPGPLMGFGTGIKPVTNSAILLTDGVAEAFNSVDYTNRTWWPTTVPNAAHDYNIICAV